MPVFGGLGTNLSSLQPWIISKLMIDYFRRKFYLKFSNPILQHDLQRKCLHKW
jgi:hypothetical protein